jgi:hypothetical protein
MAEELDEFPGGPTKSRFPWDDWLNGKPWLHQRGEVYEVKTTSLRVSAFREAASRGLKIRTRIVNDNGGEALVIQAYEV